MISATKNEHEREEKEAMQAFACFHLSSAQARTIEGRYMHIFYPIL